MSWATGRQFKYLTGLFAVIALIVFIIIYPIITKKATCFDGIQNGGEAGVDCGGLCNNFCSSEVSEPIILWSRAFPLTGNTYNLVALVENQNISAAIKEVSYEFKIYDVNNLLIGRKSGTTYIPPNKQFAIFEPRFDAGQNQIKSVSFEFLKPFNWVKKESISNTLPIVVDRIIKGEDKNTPTLTARINNDSVYDIPAFDVIAILYDSNHNAINVSKTYKEGLQSSTSTPVFFTWPEAFTSEPVTQDVFIQINPFDLSF